MLSLIRRTRGKKATVPGYLVFILFGGVICFLIYQQAIEEYRFRQSGVSVAAQVVGISDRNGFFVNLHYTYAFSRKRYHISEMIPSARARSFEAGESIQIWIQPDRPQDPSLERRGLMRYWFGFLFGASLIGGGLFGLAQLNWLRRRRNTL